MKMISIFASAMIGLTTSASIAMASAPVANFAINANETYIGSIAYSGGLLERGELVLTQPQELKFLRFDVPSFCKGEIFEAGTVTEGVADIAEEIKANYFSVNSGRGMRAGKVFVSVNGPQAEGCSILVFKLEKAPGNDPLPPGPRSFTCVSNQTDYTLGGQIQSVGSSQPYQIAPHQTIMIQRPISWTAPVSLVFDEDLTPGYRVVALQIEGKVQSRGDCGDAPSYSFFEDRVSRKLILIRSR